MSVYRHLTLAEREIHHGSTSPGQEHHRHCRRADAKQVHHLARDQTQQRQQNLQCKPGAGLLPTKAQSLLPQAQAR